MLLLFFPFTELSFVKEEYERARFIKSALLIHERKMRKMLDSAEASKMLPKQLVIL